MKSFQNLSNILRSILKMNIKGSNIFRKASYEDAKMYVDMIPEFHEYGLDKEFDLVMSDLFTASKMHMTWKEYRTGLTEYKSEYPL